MKGKQNGEATSVTNPPGCGGGGGGGGSSWAAAPMRGINAASASASAAAAAASGKDINWGLTERIFASVTVLLGSDGRRAVQSNCPSSNASKLHTSCGCSGGCVCVCVCVCLRACTRWACRVTIACVSIKEIKQINSWTRLPQLVCKHQRNQANQYLGNVVKACASIKKNYINTWTL
jgi:hypothetical protein